MTERKREIMSKGTIVHVPIRTGNLGLRNSLKLPVLNFCFYCNFMPDYKAIDLIYVNISIFDTYICCLSLLSKKNSSLFTDIIKNIIIGSQMGIRGMCVLSGYFKSSP